VYNIKIKKGEYMVFGNRGFGRSFDGPREMHKAVCADCKKECEVPFKPSGDRPVYCKECYPKHRKY
jgi:CxxC-x17-CxxC domain-containing protein